MEIFFDMSHSDTYGEAQGPWRDFRPDYVVGVTGSNGALTKEFYWRWTGSAWDKKEGADIPEVDIAFAHPITWKEPGTGSCWTFRTRTGPTGS